MQIFLHNTKLVYLNQALACDNELTDQLIPPLLYLLDLLYEQLIETICQSLMHTVDAFVTLP